MKLCAEAKMSMYVIQIQRPHGKNANPVNHVTTLVVCAMDDRDARDRALCWLIREGRMNDHHILNSKLVDDPDGVFVARH